MAYIILTFHCCYLFIVINLQQGELSAVGNTEWGYRPYEITFYTAKWTGKVLLELKCW